MKPKDNIVSKSEARRILYQLNAALYRSYPVKLDKKAIKSVGERLGLYQKMDEGDFAFAKRVRAKLMEDITLSGLERAVKTVEEENND